MPPSAPWCVRQQPGWEVFGVHRGYQGLIDDDMEVMTRRSVSGIVQKGGTVLQTARSDRFRTEEGQLLALHNLKRERDLAPWSLSAATDRRAALWLCIAWATLLLAWRQQSTMTFP